MHRARHRAAADPTPGGMRRCGPPAQPAYATITATMLGATAAVTGASAPVDGSATEVMAAVAPMQLAADTRPAGSWPAVPAPRSTSENVETVQFEAVQVAGMVDRVTATARELATRARAAEQARQEAAQQEAARLVAAQQAAEQQVAALGAAAQQAAALRAAAQQPAAHDTGRRAAAGTSRHAATTALRTMSAPRHAASSRAPAPARAPALTTESAPAGASAPASGLGARALRAAMTRLGKPYVWGAAGPNAFDCSGLVMWAFAQAGTALPHSSTTQSTMGAPVSRDQLRPGDLVFFYSPVRHVGIYIGDGKVINATTSGQPVQITDIAHLPIHNARRL